MENTDVLEILSSSVEFVSVDENILSNYQQIIQTILCSGTTKESHIETRVILYNDKKTKNSIEVLSM